MPGLAAGVWVVGKQYVMDCKKAGRLLPEVGTPAFLFTAAFV